jgi:potassium-transporting ATPase KdpC subunit
MLKTIVSATRMLLVLTIITGAIYPLAITLGAQVLMPSQANGSLLMNADTVVGSALIGQNMNGDPRYFWSRPSAINYNPLPSSGSNLSPISSTLASLVSERSADFITQKGLNEGSASVPADMVFASASGLDPHISPESARLQVARIAEARGLEEARVFELVERFIESPQIGFLGQPRVNVLLLNIALDELQ